MDNLLERIILIKEALSHKYIRYDLCLNRYDKYASKIMNDKNKKRY